MGYDSRLIIDIISIQLKSGSVNYGSNSPLKGGLWFFDIVM